MSLWALRKGPFGGLLRTSTEASWVLIKFSFLFINIILSICVGYYHCVYMRCVGSKAPKRALKGHRLLVLEAPTGLRLLGIRFSPSTSSKGSVGPGKGPVTAKKPRFGGALRTRFVCTKCHFY